MHGDKYERYGNRDSLELTEKGNHKKGKRA